MISLYESILKSVGAGKHAMIEKWCQENNPFAGNWEITKNDEIACKKPGIDLILPFDTYHELPDYIQFAEDTTLRVKILNNSNQTKIDSLRGIPKSCRKFIISAGIRELPSFELKCCYFALHTPNLRKTGKIEIELFGDGGSEDRVVRIKDMPYEKGKSFADLLPNLHIKGAAKFDVMNGAYLGDTFSKLLNRKAEMNKYVGKFEFPIKDEALPLIKAYFGKNFDMSHLEEIIYTQASCLIMKNGKWYRCKNRI